MKNKNIWEKTIVKRQKIESVSLIKTSLRALFGKPKLRDSEGVTAGDRLRFLLDLFLGVTPLLAMTEQ